MQDSFFARSAATVARDLVGARIFVGESGGIIVETEAYDRTDPASHSFAGPTARNASMFGPPGHAYVYRAYGLHWCLNVVCEAGSAVLLRALEPTEGVAAMEARRAVTHPRLLCAGPGRLCQALGVTGALDGWPLARPPFRFEGRAGSAAIVADRRIGITRGAETPWRFLLAGSRFVSRPVQRPGSGNTPGHRRLEPSFQRTEVGMGQDVDAARKAFGTVPPAAPARTGARPSSAGGSGPHAPGPPKPESGTEPESGGYDNRPPLPQPDNGKGGHGAG